MVLAELGSRISKAISTMRNTTVLDEKAIDSMIRDIQRALIEADVNFRLLADMGTNIKKVVNADQGTGFNKRKLIQEAVVRELRRILDPQVKAYELKKGRSNVIMFVGLQGAGKTTTITKYALYYQKLGWKTAVVCADTFRAGAYDQLKQNAARANIKFFGNISETDPVALAQEGVAKWKRDGMEVIIVDTSGRHKQETALFDEMQQVVAAIKPNDIVFVLDSSIGQAAMAQAQAFKGAVNVGSVIITKLDGHAKGGGALSAVAATHAPITFIGLGEHFDQFEPFDSSRFVNRLLGLGDVEGLVDKIKSSGIDQNNELYKRVSEGAFTMRDMQELLKDVTKLGSMDSFMEMLPGFNMGSMKGKDFSGQNIKIFLTIMDSMNDKELDCPTIKKLLVPKECKDHIPPRIIRIARGSGRHIQEVRDLLRAYDTIEELVKKLGKKGFKQLAKDPTSLMRNGQLGTIAKAMNPQVLQQMGGMSGFQNLMRQLQQSGLS